MATQMHEKLMAAITTASPNIARPSNYSYKASTITAEALVPNREPDVHDRHDAKTGTWQYIVADPATRKAVIIDPVLDYDSSSGKITTSNADALLSIIKEKAYFIDMILETHVHADHLTAASYLQKQLGKLQGSDGPSVGIGKRMTEVQKVFGQRYGVPEEAYQNAFDTLFDDDEEFQVGSIKAIAIHIPGHTPDHMGYMIGDNVFIGDSLFSADLGSARADFPGGSATDLYHSGQKLLRLPDKVRLWTGHDYPHAERNVPISYTTVKDQREQNKHFKNAVGEEEFVQVRQERDSSLPVPKLMHSALPVNILAGRLNFDM